MAEKRPFYQDRHELFEGAIVLFRRNDSWRHGKDRIWQARFKLFGMAGYKQVSLKTTDYEDAHSHAKEQFFRFQQMVKEGAALRERTFSQAWHEWFNEMDANGVWSASRRKWHQNYFNRYFNPFFGFRKLDDITMEFANGYWAWRKRYWLDGPGVNPAANQIKYNRRRRGLPNRTTHNAKKNPAHKTLLMEQSALNQIFSWCYSSKRFMRYSIKMKAPSGHNQTEGRRASFTDDEWESIKWNLQDWANGTGKYAQDRLNDYHRHHRKQLRYFVLFIANTGIRPGTETRFMKWEDLSPLPVDTVNQKTDKKAHEVILRIAIRQSGKKRVPRTVVSLPNAVDVMNDWRKISHYPDDQHFVWYGMSKSGSAQKPATDLNKTFQAFLKTVDYKGRKDGLLNDAEGNRRSLYSMRHLYAAKRVRAGVSYEDLRRTMGTGIPQLVKHYDDVTSVQRAAEIIKVHSDKYRERYSAYLTPAEYEKLSKYILASKQTKRPPTEDELQKMLTPEIKNLLRKLPPD